MKQNHDLAWRSLVGPQSPPRQAGMSLILVLMIGLVAAGVAAVTAFVSMSSSQANAEWQDIASEALACESVAELLRAEVVADFEQSGLPGSIWLEEVRDGNRFGPGVVKSYPKYPDVQAWVADVAPAGSGSLWVEVFGGTIDGASVSGQSVRERIHFGANAVMDFALLTKTTNCMFCHIQITGDVGSLGPFRPGWGSGSRGVNSGKGSHIEGNVYSTDAAIEGTGAYVGTLNGTTYSGTVYDYYDGIKLPEDTNGDGTPDFPALDPAKVSANAKGAIWAGNATNNAGDGSGLWVTPLLGTWNPAAATTTSAPAMLTGPTWMPAGDTLVGSVIDGNLTLVGTQANPILLDGDVFVAGDVVIRGYVKGQGAIYAGRNAYIAGDVIYSDPPGVMKGDVDAVTAIKAKRDELRLAARNNIVLGDWTYRNADGSVQQMRDRQGQSFVTDAFSLNDVRHYDATDGTTSSSELTLVNGKYLNDLGQEIPASRVVTVDGSTTLGYQGTRSDATVLVERYDATMAPGQVLSDGSFHSWMNQDDFRQVIGTQQYADMMYRFPSTSDPSVGAQEIGNSAFNALGSMSNGSSWFDKDYFVKGSESPSGQDLGLYVNKGNTFTQVIETGLKDWTTVVTRIDGFLYSNKRISGLTPMITGLTVNGGMVSGEVQVLAPGRGHSVGWFKTPGYGDTFKPSVIWENTTALSYHGDKQDGLYLNYDYRLRNGGLGFNLIAGKTGDRLHFSRGGQAYPPGE